MVSYHILDYTVFLKYGSLLLAANMNCQLPLPLTAEDSVQSLDMLKNSDDRTTNIYIIIYICSCTAFSRNRLNGSQFHALFGRHVPVSSSFKVAHPIPFQPLLLLLTTFLKSISRMLFRTANLCDPWMSWIQFR